MSSHGAVWINEGMSKIYGERDHTLLLYKMLESRGNNAFCGSNTIAD